MLTDISLGQYVAGESFIHHLDPRTKTLAALAVAVAVLQGKGLPGTLYHLALASACVALARLPLRFVGRSARPFTWLIGVVIVAHIAVEGFRGWQTGVALGGRLLAVILIAWLLSWTTQPLHIVAGLRSLGSPLRLFRLPVDAAATAIGLALRFAPIALVEAQTILRAQAARGADMRGIRAKIRLLVPLLGALFERAFSRADTLAEAMESRGFVHDGRMTHYRRLGFTSADAAACAGLVLWITLGIIIDRGVF